MDLYIYFVIIIFCVPIIFTVLTAFKNKYISKYPPSCGEYVPWMGCGISFGKEPLRFIEQTRKQLGEVFTLKAAGKRLTFLTHYSDFKHFFKNTSVDFQKGVQDTVKHAASIGQKQFYEGHKKMHDLIKGKLARVAGLSKTMCTELQQTLAELPDRGEHPHMLGLIREIMYRPEMTCLFGKDVVVSDNREAYKQFESHFVNYDSKFQYGSQMPEFLVRSWAKSKAFLLNNFKRILKESGDVPKTDNMNVLQSMMTNLDPNIAPNFATLLLWAALANAIPITFWMMCFILSNPEIEARLREEVDQVIGPYSPDLEITPEQIQKLPYMKRCLFETIRMRSPGVIVRKVVKDFSVRGYNVPAGDMLMVSPYWAHRNPDIFTNPDTFDPSRWRDEELEKFEYREGFIPFGGGRYQCPGRWFAMMEVQMSVALMLSKYDMKLRDHMPDVSYCSLVGSQQPNKLCPVAFSVKNKTETTTVTSTTEVTTEMTTEST